MTYRLGTLVCLTILCAHAQAQTPARAAKPGDVHVYAAEQRTDKLSFEETITVTAVEGDRIKTNHLRSDKPAPMEGLYGRDWSTFKSGTTGLQLNPASRVLSLPLTVGKSWDSAYDATTITGGKLRVKLDSKVVAEEKVSTPAGEFQTFRIDSEGYVNGVSFPGGWAIRQKVWYAPAIDRIVRVEFKELRTLGADNISVLKQFKPAD